MFLMNHDPLCPLNDEQWPKHPLEKCHYCDLIAAVRQDERDKDLDYRYVAAQAEADMLAKAIAAVEHLHDHEAPHDAHKDALWNAITALRALQEQP